MQYYYYQCSAILQIPKNFRDKREVYIWLPTFPINIIPIMSCFSFTGFPPDYTATFSAPRLLPQVALWGHFKRLVIRNWASERCNMDDTWFVEYC